MALALAMDDTVQEALKVMKEAERKVEALGLIFDAYARALEDKNTRIPTYLHAAIENARRA